MKIHLLPVPERLRPSTQPFRYPRHNQDYGVEQDFYDYLAANRPLLTDDPREADWHYLPVFWTRWHLNHDYGKHGQEELQQAVSGILQDDAKTFTICQYDDGPMADLGRTVQFLASRKTGQGRDIPLLASPHRRPFWTPSKRYLASFVGRISTHPVRPRMAEALNGRRDVLIYDGDRGPGFFVRKTLGSYLALAPRGYGGSSFRFFEALQLGVVPILIGDLDTRPLKRSIDWDSCSFYVSDPAKLPSLIDSLDRERLVAMGQHGAEVYRERLAFGKWCRFVLDELEKDQMS